MQPVKKTSSQSETMVSALTPFKITNTNQKRILDGQTSSSNTESGFSNVPLTSYSSTPLSGHFRRSSNTSIASDVSFLPHYESPTNMYHMQSDLDISASEVEDNASTSSQLGHLTKEQIYSAFQKAQQRYHKYRGRYTDVARHYKDLERENTKVRSVLVETQDKALRRISELREQCSLEQKAKAHLENSLRVDLDEKQYIIDSLKTKVDLLHANKNTDVLLVHPNDVKYDNEVQIHNNTEVATKELNDSKIEIEALNARIQEMKANSIIFNSKEADLKSKITELEDTIRAKSTELLEIVERERENNLIIAQTKMELHTEIQNRDLEIETLKHDVETLQSDLNSYETKSKNVKPNKLENLQTQNLKLIEKVEDLTQKCNNYESNLLKMEQFKNENQSLYNDIESNKKIIEGYENSMKEKDELLQQQKVNHEEAVELLRDKTKHSLLSLESKVREKLQQEFSAKEDALALDFQNKLQSLAQVDQTQDIQLRLLNQESELKQKELEQIIENEKHHYKNLETNHLELISESSEVRSKLSESHKENNRLRDEIAKLQKHNSDVQLNFKATQNELSALSDQKISLDKEIDTIQGSNVELQNEITRIRNELLSLKDVNVRLHDENAKLHSSKPSDALVSKLKAVISDLQNNIRLFQEKQMDLETQQKSLQEENSVLQSKFAEFQIERDDVSKLNNLITELTEGSSNLEEKLKDTLQINQEYQNKLSEKQDLLSRYETKIHENKIELENLQRMINKTSDYESALKNQKLEAEEYLKEERLKFHEEIKSLKSEILKFKEHNQTVQGYIKEYKSKLTEYETHTSETTIQLQTVTNENAVLRGEVSKLKSLVESSETHSTNLVQQLNSIIQENGKVSIYEELVNKHLNDKSADLTEKIKFLSNLNSKLKESNLQHETNNNNLDSRLKDIMNENSILKEQIVQLETQDTNKSQHYDGIKSQLINYEEKYETLTKQIVELNGDLLIHKNKLSVLENVEEDKQTLHNEKLQLLYKLEQTQTSVEELQSENNRLISEVAELQREENVIKERLSDHQSIKAEIVRITGEVSELKHRNKELSLDYKQITAENEELVTELAESKLKLEAITTEKIKKEDFAKRIEIEKAELLNELKEYRSELDKLKATSLELEGIQEIDNLLNDNKTLKLHLAQLEERCQFHEKQQKLLEGQLRESENQYTEISHEKQLLQDEIQELKISPINVFNTQKLDNLDILQSTKIIPLETSNSVPGSTNDHLKEIDDLNEKLIQYKSLDLTNRSSLQFYENELQKLRNKNEKLNRKLDETLVTLSHCAELSHSTETEYLKNVLYNYMIGKESVVLARVIAAVCKFDDTQTNTILQREQQKQTLLGQLGIL